MKFSFGQTYVLINASSGPGFNAIQCLVCHSHTHVMTCVLERICLTCKKLHERNKAMTCPNCSLTELVGTITIGNFQDPSPNILRVCVSCGYEEDGSMDDLDEVSLSYYNEIKKETKHDKNLE